MPYKNPEARNAYARQYYAKNKDKHLALVRKNKIGKKKVFQEAIAEYKRQPCADCGNKFPPVCMDFDHLPEHQKLFNISTVTNGRSGWTLEDLLTEIAKCEVVCANCHRIRTANRRGVEKVGISPGS